MTPAAAMSASRPSLEDRTESLTEWARVHTREVSIGGLVLVAIIGLLWLYRYSSAQQLRHADEQLLAPQRSLAAGNIPLAQTDLKRLLTRYAGTPAATQAAMLLAETYYQQQKFAEGVAVLVKAPRAGGSAPFAPGVEALQGDGYAEQGKYRDAAAHYRQAADLSPYTGDKARYKAMAARAYTTGADTANALTLWRDLAKDDTRPEAGEAHLRIGELTARPAK